MHSRHFYWLHRYHNDHGGNTISGITINNFEFFFVPIKNSSSQSKEQCSYAFCTWACTFHCKIKGTSNCSSEKRLCSYAFFCTCTYASAPRSRVLASISLRWWLLLVLYNSFNIWMRNYLLTILIPWEFRNLRDTWNQQTSQSPNQKPPSQQASN